MNDNNFGSWLRAEREKRGLSRFGLWWKTGIAFWTIGKLEDGKSLPKARGIRSISEIFGLPAYDIAALAGIGMTTKDDLVETLGDNAHRLKGLSEREINDLCDDLADILADIVARKKREDARHKNDLA